MTTTRTGLALHALLLLGILGIGGGLGIGFAVPAAQAVQSKIPAVRAMLDGSVLQFQLAAALAERRR
ncbi:hypothetical protein [Falsiroseomonas stagni]|uniref:Uncharacterized protein n=1 Tax=Falsiroseomonas stagni DSM 19981 TaxID=1123062 RepID=A0A1I4D0W3_9PROT|nr:hypothetical protein [Falsiroseomonas stagni]SFK87188.1 hypothetical protein SAMN02745775_10966 [Falsiroseomonas stagni DSM 19981]